MIFYVDAQIQPGVFSSLEPVLEAPGELPRPLTGAYLGGIIFSGFHRDQASFQERFQRLINSAKS